VGLKEKASVIFDEKHILSSITARVYITSLKSHSAGIYIGTRY
jgi:hypothetical protein